MLGEMVRRGSHHVAQVSLQPMGSSGLPVPAPGVPASAVCASGLAPFQDFFFFVVVVDALSPGLSVHHLPVPWRH